MLGVAAAQGVDCARLQAQIAAADQGGAGRYAQAAQRQRAELDRTLAYARSLQCDRQQFLFFGSPPPAQCGPLNARIAQMQGNLAQLEGAASGGARQNLVASYNAYCRGGTAQAAQPRGFFQSLFGGGFRPSPTPGDDQLPSGLPVPTIGDGEVAPRGGSQAVCVRSCDGGFFPLNGSARRGGESLVDMCRALCPNAEVSVYTKAPASQIQTAVSLDGTPYADLPNALKFQKSFDATCTCRPPNQSWAQALAPAEQLLGQDRRGDIVVTPEKAAELSRPKLDPKVKVKLLEKPPVDDPSAAEAAAAAQVPTASHDSAGIAAEDSPKAAVARQRDGNIVGPDGVKRHVRVVGPKL
jgi:hypothetical protein